MVTTGFTFNGVHSEHYGIVVNPSQRIIFPEKRRIMTDVPGRSGYHVYTDGTFLPRQETFHCYFKKPAEISLADAARNIALWLNAENAQLIFDNEPDKFYYAFVIGALPQERHLKYGEFDLTFCYSPPFAYTEMKEIVMIITSNTGEIQIPVIGTADTPVRITIRNIGNKVINNIRVIRKVQ